MSILDTSLIFHFLASEAPPAFWFLTAWNPRGASKPLDSNRLADQELGKAVAWRRPFRILAVKSDNEIGVPGWGFAGDQEQAILLAKHFDQRHAFQFADGQISRLDVNTLEWSPCGPVCGCTLDPSSIRHFTLFVGSCNDKDTLSYDEINMIIEWVGKSFTGFSYHRSMGRFKNSTEDTLEIGIGTHEYQKVLNLAHTIRVETGQTGIGILHNGIYQRVREWTDDGLILQSFGLTGQ